MVRQIVTTVALCATLFANEYYLTYKLYSQDLTLFNESVMISPVMVARGGTPYTVLHFSTDAKTVGTLLKTQKYDLVDAILSHSANIASQTDTVNYTARIKTQLQIYPTRIKVKINNGLAKIGLYK
ncbi:MAG: hypothetical protein ACQESH_01255 [Campylobacterota bacterium]